MARASITLPSDLLAELSSLVGARSKTAAVEIAVRDRIRQEKLERIKGMVGHMDFVTDADDLRHSDERLG